jgi:hypothetical protein
MPTEKPRGCVSHFRKEKNMRKTVFVLSVLLAIICNASWSSAETIYQKKLVIKSLRRAAFSGRFTVPNIQARHRLILLNEGASTARVIINRINVVNEKSLGDRVERDITLKASNTLSVIITGKKGSKLSLMIESLVDRKITIIFPPDGATLYTPTTVARGTFTAASEDVGLTVNGLPAAVSEETWAAEVRLTEGANTITAKVMEFSGETEKSISVNAVPSEFISVEAGPKSGISPLAVTFRLISTPEENCSVDYEGDGVFDYEGTSDEISHTYNTPGIYIPTFVCGEYRAETLVNVFSKDKLDTHLRSRWQAMKSSLARGDVGSAVMNFSYDSQDWYRKQFEAFQKGGILPLVVNELESSVVTFVSVSNNKADYEVLVVRDGKTLSFPLQFTQDPDGIWRIWKY